MGCREYRDVGVWEYRGVGDTGIWDVGNIEM